MSSGHLVLTTVTAVSMLIAAAPAAAAPKHKEPAPVGELSSGGTDRGGFELALGAITLGVAASLGVVGGLAVASGIDKRDNICQYGFERDTCQLIPPSLDFASAGLSFALMVPLTVAGALLLRKGTRIRRDHQRFHAQAAALSVAASRTTMAVSWTWRF